MSSGVLLAPPALGEDGPSGLFDVEIRALEVGGVARWGCGGDMKLFRDLGERHQRLDPGPGLRTYEVSICQMIAEESLWSAWAPRIERLELP